MTLLALGTATILLSLLFRHHLTAQTGREAGIVDMVVGAGAYPMELVLNSVLHLGAPGPRTDLQDFDFLRTNPHVERSAPVLALDRVREVRLLASTRDLFALYGARIQTGRLFDAPFEAVLGASAARTLASQAGDVLVVDHGLGADPSMSDRLQHDRTLRTVGVLAPTGTVLDELVITSLNTSWRMHERRHGSSAQASGALDLDLSPAQPSKGVHALLIRFTSPGGAQAVAPLIASRPGLISADPRADLTRLGRMFDQGLEVMGISAFIFVILAVLSLLAALYGALDQRQFDLALMRTLGASRLRVSLSIMLDGLLLSALGALLGLAIAHAGAQLSGLLLNAGQRVQMTGAIWLPGEGTVLASIMAAGVLCAFVPAIKAYRLDISSVLSRRF